MSLLVAIICLLICHYHESWIDVVPSSLSVDIILGDIHI